MEEDEAGRLAKQYFDTRAPVPHSHALHSLSSRVIPAKLDFAISYKESTSFGEGT